MQGPDAPILCEKSGLIIRRAGAGSNAFVYGNKPGLYFQTDNQFSIKENCLAVTVPLNGEQTSNNLAEYGGFTAALQYLLGAGLTGEAVIISGDSKLVIEQMAGRWRMNAGAYVRLARQAQLLLTQFERPPELVWIPREQNAEADRLSKARLTEVGITPRFSR